MPTDIVIPTVGESVTEGVVAAWLKGDGAWVEQDETVLELETDKITMEIPAPAAGILRHGAKKGDTVQVGSSVGSVDGSASRPAAQAASASEDASATAAASVEHRAIPSVPRAQTTTPTEATPPPRPEPAPGPDDARNGDLRATPLAHKMASDFGVNLRDITPTGPGQRIREQDVLAFVQSKGGAQAHAGARQSPAVGSASPAPRPRATARERMSPLRQRIAARLVEAQQTAAMLTTFNECDMTSVMALRARYKEAFQKKHDIALGFMGFFVKAACSALRAYPKVNAFIVDDAGKPAIETHDYCDIAVAVSTPKGLTVPVIRNAETLSLAGIEGAIKDLAARAKDGKLDLEDITGGTFTITNGGVFGSLQSTPILNPPQSAILGMHAIKNRPVEHPEKPGEIALRPMMYLALSYDHRIVDGAEAVSFLKHIKECVEDPTRLLLDM